MYSTGTQGRDILQDGYRSLVSCETFLKARLRQITDDWPVRMYERSRDLQLLAFFSEKAAPLALSHP